MGLKDEPGLAPQVLEARFRILREIVVTMARSLVEKAGSKKSLEILTPYMTNAGAAMSINLGQFHGSRLSPPHAVAIIGRWANEILEIKTRTELTTIGARAHFLSCPFHQPPIEMCMAHIVLGPKGMCDNAAPDFECTYSNLMPEGDEECTWICKRKGDNLNEALKAEVVAEGLDPFLPDDVMRMLEARILIEWWDIFIRAMIDHAGKEEGMAILEPLMRTHGVSASKEILDLSKVLDAEGPKLVASVIRTCGTIIGLEKRNAEPLSLDGEVSECPFSNLPPEICNLYEEFVKGACQAIAPDYEFTYDHMMTRGDKICHWVIRRKGEPPMMTPKEQTALDDPAKILAIRYAKGELDEEELDKKMAQLRKHGLAK